MLNTILPGLAENRNAETSTSASCSKRSARMVSARISRATSFASATPGTLSMSRGETARTSMNVRTPSHACTVNAATKLVGSSAPVHLASNFSTVDMVAWTDGRELAMHTSTRQPAVLSVDVGLVRASVSQPAAVDLARPGVQIASLVRSPAVLSINLSVLEDLDSNPTKRL